MIVDSMIQFGEVFSDVMIAASLKAAIIVPTVWVVLRAARVKRPAVEHGIWAATMIVMLALPLLGIVALIPGVTSPIAIETGIPAMATVPLGTIAISDGSIALSPVVEWRGIAGLLVVSVSLILALALIVARWRVRCLVASGEIIQSQALDDELKRSLATVGLELAPSVVTNPEISSPVAFEGKVPTIILPAEWTE